MRPAVKVKMLTLPVGNDQNRRVLWEVLRVHEKIDSRLQLRAAAPLYIDCFLQTLRRHNTLIVDRRVAEYQTNGAHPTRCAVAGDRAKRCGKKRAGH